MLAQAQADYHPPQGSRCRREEKRMRNSNKKATAGIHKSIRVYFPLSTEGEFQSYKGKGIQKQPFGM